MNRTNQFRVAKARVRPHLFVAALLPGTYRAKRWTADPGEARIFTYNVARAVAGRNRGALLTAANIEQRHADQ